MPGKVKVRVLAGRNLPVMDRSSDTTDAYVEVKLGNTTYKTDVFRKSLNPQWNSEWFIFEVDDLELQDEPLQIRLMDHDTYSANDAIGKVYVDLNPLLLAPTQPIQAKASQDNTNLAGSGVMSGWLPVYDTMHGIRGEVNVLVKVDLFSDFNKFRQSSCGVQFFFTSEIPSGFRCNNIIGFVEEMVVNDDPEYQWIDKIRTPRASNEARQTLFSKLSGELQRRIGLKVLEQGGNSVIGYHQCFDLEGESGIAVRGIGSVVSLTRIIYDGTNITTHSPSPLREFGTEDGVTTNQRETLNGDITLENLYVSIPNSSQFMPVSLIHVPKMSTSPVPLKEAIFICPKRSYSVSHKTSQTTTPFTNEEGGFSNRNKVLKENLPKSSHQPRCYSLSSDTSSFCKNKKDAQSLCQRDESKKLSKADSQLEGASSQIKNKSKTFSKASHHFIHNPFHIGHEKSKFKKSFKKEKSSSERSKQHKFDFHGSPKSSHPKFKIGHVWPKCMKINNFYFKHSHLPTLRRHFSLLRGRGNDISIVANSYNAGCIGLGDERIQQNELDKEITKIETFYSGICYSHSDPTLNQSTYLRDLIKNVYLKERPLKIISDDDTQNTDTDSGSLSPTSLKLDDSSHHKFYVGDNNSSSSSSLQSLDEKFGKDYFLVEISPENPREKVKRGNKTMLSSLKIPTTDALKPPFGQKSDNCVSRRGSIWHSLPGSLPDIHVVPCSPTPSSSKSLTFGKKYEDSLSKETNQATDQFSLVSSNVNLNNNESTRAEGTKEDKGLDSLSSVDCSVPLRSVYDNSMPSDGKNLSSHSRALGVFPSHSLLCVVPAECCLYPHCPPPTPSLPHSSSLPLHISPHSLVDLTNVTTTSAELSSRSGFSPSTMSPKRGSRSRKTSGSYSISRSPQLQDGAVESAGASQSPTHSVKIASPSHTSGVFFNRRSSDSDLSITPKGGGSLTGSGGSSGGIVGVQGIGSGNKPLMNQESFDNLIYPFLTMKRFPPNFIIHLGGTVSARSVKLLDRSHLPEEADSRDIWWSQLRTEIKSHARSIACNVVLGYEEFTTICDEVCVLSATGTAAVINISHQELDGIQNLTSKALNNPLSFSLDKKDLENVTNKCPKDPQVCLRLKASSPRPLKRLIQQQNPVCRSHPNVIEDIGESGIGSMTGVMKLPTQAPAMTQAPLPPCAVCHIPYMELAKPFNVKILKCSICRKGKVPDVLLTTLELPSTIPVTGQGCLIQARVIRSKRDLKGELNAKEISDSLPFLEYELHKQLYQKIMIRGMNALFGLRVRVTVGEKWVVGLGTGTAVFLTALPPPPMPRVVISGTGGEVEKKRIEMQKKIQEVFEKNKELFGLKFNVDHPAEPIRPVSESKSSDTEDSEEELFDIDLSSGNKDAYILDLDDSEDVEMLKVLIEGCSPPHLLTVSTQTPPGFPLEQTVTNLQMFTRVWRGKMPTYPSRTTFSSFFEGLMQSIYFKVRNLSPCIISGLKVDVELPEADEIQISVLGMVLGQGQPPFAKSSSCGSQAKCQQELEAKKNKMDDSGDLMFQMEEVGREAEEKSSSQPHKAPSGVNHSCNTFASGSGLHRSTSSTHSFPSVPSIASISSGSSSGRSSFKTKTAEKQAMAYHLPPKGDHFGVEITPLSFIPGARIERFLGNLNFFFIRESTSIKENGGLGGFMGSFVTEVLALVRAHVAAVGGNAMISYFLSQCVLLHNPHKNQGQCLINVGGDIVKVTYGNPATQEHGENHQQMNSSITEQVNSINNIISE